MICSTNMPELSITCTIVNNFIGDFVRKPAIKVYICHMEIIAVLLAFGLAAALCAVFVLRGRLSDARNALVSQKEEYERSSAAAEERFSVLAAKALASNAESLRRQNLNGLAEVLAPMQANIETFRKSIAERYDAEARERFALDKRVSELVEVNRIVGKEAAKLTAALKGNARVQGEWGEMILENILRAAGFRQGYEYEVQESVTDAEGKRLRPDVIINYSDNRKIIVDSKVSIQDYLNMIEASTESAREAYARAHLSSVKKHVGELCRKSYQDAVSGSTYDYVLMFIPNEGAFLSALDLDSKLWQTAYDSHVLIISPTHLMAIVKLIEQMWRNDKQNRNAVAIAEEAGRMLDKFRGFLEDLDRIDKSLGQARDAWNSAYTKLSTGAGNLIGRSQKLAQLGAKVKKQMPARFNVESDD